MGISKVTDYMIEYMEQHYIETKRLARDTGIPEQKIKKGYVEPLESEEFFELCCRLQIRPDDVLKAIRKS